MLPLLHAAVNDMVNALDDATAQGPTCVDMCEVLQRTTMHVIGTSALGVPLGGHGGGRDDEAVAMARVAFAPPVCQRKEKREKRKESAVAGMFLCVYCR